MKSEIIELRENGDYNKKTLEVHLLYLKKLEKLTSREKKCYVKFFEKFYTGPIFCDTKLSKE